MADERHFTDRGLQTWRSVICRAGYRQGHVDCGPDCPMYRFTSDVVTCEDGIILNRNEAEKVIRNVAQTEPWKSIIDDIFERG